MCLIHLLKHKATALIGAVGSNETIGNLLLTNGAHGLHLMAWDILTLSPARPMMAHRGHFHLFNKSIFRCAVISVLVWYEQEALVILYHDGKFREYSCLFRGQLLGEVTRTKDGCSKNLTRMRTVPPKCNKQVTSKQQTRSFLTSIN
jgi:hypothetical protein